MVGHEGQSESTGERNVLGELPCQKIEHGDGEGAKDQGYNAKVSFGFFEWEKKMGEDKKEGRMEEGWVFLVIG